MIAELIQAGTRLSPQIDRRLSVGLYWSVIEALFSAAPYLLLYKLLQQVFENQMSSQLAWLYGALLLILIGLRIAAARQAMPLIFAGCYAMMGEARLRLADHLRKLPLGWFGHQRSGDLSARLTGDLQVVEHLWSHFLGIFVAGLTMQGCLLLFLFWLDWRLALVLLVSLLLAIAVLDYAQRLAARPMQRMIMANSSVQAALLEYIQGIAVIRGFGRFGQAWQRLEAVLDEQLSASLAVELKPTPWMAGFGFMLDFGYFCVLLAGLAWLETADLPMQTLLIFLVLALPVYRQLFEIGLSTTLLRFASHALKRIEQVLAAPPMAEPEQPECPDRHDIVFDQVSFSYQSGQSDPADQTDQADRPAALQNLSCTILAGALTAVVGASGAGKSSLVHLIARLWEVDSGAIRIGGIDLRRIGMRDLHSQVAMVFQDVLLFSGTVLDNIKIGNPQASRQQIMEAARRARAHDFIEALPMGYNTVLDEGGASLSGGERQRISIARALLKNAPILLLDEATASIDPSAAAEIQQAISELAQGRTVVAIGHHLPYLRDADHILVLDQGRLVEQGRHAELLRQQGVYAKLWHAQQQARGWQLNTAADTRQHYS